MAELTKVIDSSSEVTQALIQALGAETVLLDEDVNARGAGIWRTDNIRAQVLVRPKTTEQVAAALKVCHAYDQSVVTHGGLTGLVEGALTNEGDVIISLERMNEIEEVLPLERTMIAQAGVPLQVVQEIAESHGLMFPLDLGARGSCTIGGNISTNAGGNRVIRYGMMRDMVLGLEAVLMDGTVISSMNQMIKNNAGYDLKQLFIGTEGTLGIVTRAVLRCREEVTTQPTALVGIVDFDHLVRFLKHADRGLGGNLSAFEVMWNDYYRLVSSPPAQNSAPLSCDYGFYVLVEGMGANDETLMAMLNGALEDELIADAVIAQSEAQRMDIWALRDDVEQVFQFAPTMLFDVSLRIPLMEDYVDGVYARLQSEFEDAKVFTLGHMGDGNIHFAIAPGDDKTETRKRVEACVYEPLEQIGGSVSAEHGVGLEKKPYLSLVRDETEIDLMRRMKHALDPKGLLNPGKIFDAS
ncbi:MAG: FAD-binding protein [Pseudomonadales bacterium]|nr:FAD-binding protein [Pseudomonadales bacterium]